MKAGRKTILLMVVLCLLLTGVPGAGIAQEEEAPTGEWVDFVLICNEGMLNTGGDVGNTIMIVSMNPETMTIKLLSILWNVFIDYPGYETMQLLERPFRVNGPDEVVRLLNLNFNQHFESYLSINFMNLAGLIDDFGGVKVDVTRGERNALNGMVASKVKSAQTALSSLELDENMYQNLLETNFLADFGVDTHLNGLQAVGYGWLQYDTVYNCCQRELAVITSLFEMMRDYLVERVQLYSGSEAPEDGDPTKRQINKDNITDEDRAYVLQLLSPLVDRSFNNLSREQIDGIIETILRSTDDERALFPLVIINTLPEVSPLSGGEPPTTMIGGVNGIVVDLDAARLFVNTFLFERIEEVEVEQPVTPAG